MAETVGTTREKEVLGDLIDALNDELSYEISKSPHVQEHVKQAILALGGPWTGYLDAWWLQ